MSDESGSPGAGLSLALSEDGRKLLAGYAPTADSRPFDVPWLKQLIVQQGYGELHLFEPAMAQLIKQYASAGETPFSIEIGEVRDAVVALALSPDNMAAYLDITPPCGGAPVAPEQIRQALAEKRVVFGVLDEAIDQAVERGEAHHVLIVQGRPAIDGTDARLHCLIELVRERHPHLDEHGVANYRNLGGIVTVAPGERLMKKFPALPGEPGMNLLGQVIPAKPGKDIQFATQLKGTRFDPADPLVLLADISGQPVQITNGMTIEPTVSIDTVDLNSGNLDFDGTINIKGDVLAGTTVRASGDIHVGGTVEAAVLDAGGNVVIKGGFIGNGEMHDHSNDGKKSTVTRAGASFSALFVENARVEAGDSIMIEKVAMQSELAAVNQIVVGQPGSGRGSIIGGTVQATLLVQTGTIGSRVGVKTRVLVGTNPYLHEKLTQATKQFEAKSRELEEIIKLLSFIEAYPGKIKPETQHKAENTRIALLEAIEVARQYKDELALQLGLAEDAKVLVEKAVFNNVLIEIGGKVHPVEVERGKGIFSLKEGEIDFS